MLDIKITKNPAPKAKPADESKLGFGKIFSDHMFLMDYTDGRAGTTPASCPTRPSPWTRPPWSSTTLRSFSRA